MTVPRAGMAVPVLEPRCRPALALVWRLWQRLSPSPFMASMSSTDDARRRLRRLSRDRRSWDRLLARLWLAKASARRSARGDDCVTGGSGSPISAASSSGRSPSPGSSEDEASSGPESLPRRAGSMASGSTTPGSTTTTSGGSGGSDWRLPVSASSFSRRDRLRPGGRTGLGSGLGLGSGSGSSSKSPPWCCFSHRISCTLGVRAGSGAGSGPSHGAAHSPHVPYSNTWDTGSAGHGLTPGTVALSPSPLQEPRRRG